MLIDIDAGEHEGESEELWALADVLNVACGGHAGDARSMDRLVRFCKRSGKALGAHPSYPDRARFGRASVAMRPEALADSIEEQCKALGEIARAHDARILFVKPHGALYHDARASDIIARAFLDGMIAAIGQSASVIGPPQGALRERAERLGIRYLREGFADRRTREDGTLAPRTEPNALITDPKEAAKTAIAVARYVDAVCVHGDTEGAIDIARAVREVLA